LASQGSAALAGKFDVAALKVLAANGLLCGYRVILGSKDSEGRERRLKSWAKRIVQLVSKPLESYVNVGLADRA